MIYETVKKSHGYCDTIIHYVKPMNSSVHIKYFV